MPSCHNPRRTPASHAFTLLELLVVITLLTLLASLLLAATGRPLAFAKAITCRHHLREWGLATQLYASDHDDALPPEGFPNPTDRHTNSGWYIQLPRQLLLPAYHAQPWRTNPSVKPGLSPWLCPANPRRSNGRNLFHYCLNQNVDGLHDSGLPTRLSELPNPGSVIWLFDSKNLPAVGSWNFPHTNLHAGGAHFLFLDGHSQRFPSRDFWNPSNDRARTNHPDLRWIP